MKLTDESLLIFGKDIAEILNLNEKNGKYLTDWGKLSNLELGRSIETLYRTSIEYQGKITKPYNNSKI